MKEYKNISEYLEKNQMTREDLKNSVARSAVLLATECAHNFDGEAEFTEDVAHSIFLLNEIIDKVE